MNDFFFSWHRKRSSVQVNAFEREKERNRDTQREGGRGHKPKDIWHVKAYNEKKCSWLFIELNLVH